MDYLSILPETTLSIQNHNKMTHLLDPLDITHIQKTIYEYKLQKHTINSIVLNVGLLFGFTIIVWMVLTYAYKKKKRKAIEAEKARKFIEEKLEQVKVILHEKRKEEGRLITELPNINSNQDIIPQSSFNDTVNAFNFHNSFGKQFI